MSLTPDEEVTAEFVAFLCGGPAPKTCVHGFTEQHSYSPVSDNGFVFDIAMFCDGKPAFGAER